MSEFGAYKVLTEVTIDNYKYTVTWSAASEESCILWFKDADLMENFEALGRFSYFDKRNILEFIIRYTTNPLLREEISKRRFVSYLENLSPMVFKDIESLDYGQKVLAFRNLYNLDSVLDGEIDLGWKRKVLARKFHPDCGGDNHTMAIINEGYEVLKGNMDADNTKGT